jgi:hypothetical protein
MAWRKLVDADGDALAEALRDRGCGFSDWGEPAMKKVPPPYPANHMQADLLRRRSVILNAPLGDGWRAQGLLAAITEHCAAMLPVWRMLDEQLA